MQRCCRHADPNTASRCENDSGSNRSGLAPPWAAIWPRQFGRRPRVAGTIRRLPAACARLPRSPRRGRARCGCSERQGRSTRPTVGRTELALPPGRRSAEPANWTVMGLPGCPNPFGPLTMRRRWLAVTIRQRDAGVSDCHCSRSGVGAELVLVTLAVGGEVEGCPDAEHPVDMAHTATAPSTERRRRDRAMQR